MPQTLKKVLPRPLRANLRRLFYQAGFHPYPRHLFSRYRPTRHSLPEWLAYELGFHLWRYTRGRNQRMQRPIFIIGSPRSGTWISVTLFALHPDVANLSEAHDIWDPWHYRDFEADHHWTAADVKPAEAARLHARFEYYRRRHKKDRFVNKNPRSSVRVDYIRAIFPDAVLIHVIRDGRAVAASMLEWIRRRPAVRHAPMPFCHPPNWRALLRADKLEQVALQWRAIVSCVLSKRSELGPAYYEIKYEDLCREPRKVLGAAFRFAGLRADEQVLAQLPQSLESQNYKWKTQFNPKQIEMLHRIQGPLLAELGYPL
ncbi:MAG: sulfotransferase [Terriglobia bacterium]